MKLTITNRDIDDPADTREVAPVELDLAAIEEAHSPVTQDFSGPIAKAAADMAETLGKEEQQRKRRDAQAQAEAAFKAAADKIKDETGLTIGYEKPWAYRQKTKAAYGLWKRVVTMFVERPETLDIGPGALAARLDENEPNYTVTRDMMYAKLNAMAERDLDRLLAKLGVTLKLKKPASIRSVQKQLIERRDAAKELAAEEFSGHFMIRAGKAYVNGRPYTIQLGASGKRRIKLGGRDWLPLDTLKAFCSAKE